eukprot:gene14888-6024_t
MPLSKTETTLLTTGMLLLCFISVVGNLLTAIATCRISKLRTRTNILIVNLAISDILISMLAAPLRMLQTDGHAWSLRLDNCRIVIALTLFFCNASVLNLTLISIDRAASIAAPLTYNHSYASKKFALQIIASWMTSVLISLLPFFGFGWKIENEHKSGGKTIEMCRYLTILDKELKAAKMIAMVIGFFTVCVTPIVIVDITEIACGYPCAPESFVLFAVCLSYMNPAVNILAYATISSDYRKAYKQIFVSLFCCRNCPSY